MSFPNHFKVQLSTTGHINIALVFELYNKGFKLYGTKTALDFLNTCSVVGVFGFEILDEVIYICLEGNEEAYHDTEATELNFKDFNLNNDEFVEYSKKRKEEVSQELLELSEKFKQINPVLLDDKTVFNLQRLNSQFSKL